MFPANIYRFSDMLDDPSVFYPRATSERDPTVDYRIRNAVLYVMATCHSLRKVNSDLIGDPLDIKMFEFTHWTFEESSHLSSIARDGEVLDVPSAVVRPPRGIGPSIYGNDVSIRVRPLTCRLRL